MAKETDQNKPEKNENDEPTKREDAEKGVKNYFKKKKEKKERSGSKKEVNKDSLIGGESEDDDENQPKKESLRDKQNKELQSKEKDSQGVDDAEDPIPDEVVQAAAQDMMDMNMRDRMFLAQQIKEQDIIRQGIDEQLRNGNLDTQEAREMFAQVDSQLRNLRSLETRMESVSSAQMIAEAINAQTPEALKPPTRERAEAELRKPGREDGLREGEELTSERYEEYVKDWFEERYEHIEASGNQTFEEQSMLVSPIVLAYTQLELDSDTEALGRRMHEEFETRRNLHRQVIIWKLNVLEGIFQGSTGMDVRYFREIFTTSTTMKSLDEEGNVVVERRHLIAEEFRNLEKMGQELLELKKAEKGKKGRGKTQAKKETAEHIKEMMDYQMYGGYIKNEDGSTKFDVDGKPITHVKEIGRLESMLKRSNLSDEVRQKTEITLGGLKKELWARKMAGRLFSITGRAGRYDLFFNGLGDVFVTRLLNPNARLSKDAFHDGTKTIWDTERNGRKIDFGARDFITDRLISRVNYRDDEIAGTSHKKGDIKYDTLSTMGIEKKHLDLEEVTQKGGKKQDKIYMVDSLEDARLEDSEFWKELFDNRGVGPGDYGSWMDGLNRADQTRKEWIGFGKYANSPSLENYFKLAGVYENYGGDAYDELSNDRHSEKQRELYEVLDRTLEWGRKDAKKDKESDWSIFPEAEAHHWIEASYRNGMITESQREHLHSKYNGLPLISNIQRTRVGKVLRKVPILGGLFNPMTVSNTKKNIGIAIAPFRSPVMRGYVLGSTFSEWAKNALAYIFAE